MTKIVYQCWTKASDKIQGEIERSHKWALARRCWFRIYDDRIICGNWVIHISDIEDAVILEGKQLFITVRILRMKVGNKIYHFSFNPWCKVAKYLSFKVRTEPIGKIGYSRFSIIMRIIAIGIIIFAIWYDYLKK